MTQTEFVNWFDGFVEALTVFKQDAPTKDQWELLIRKVEKLRTPAKVYR